jgi:phage tail sheath gpL-like
VLGSANVYNEVWAAEVAAAVENVFTGDPSEHYMKLVEIHAAPQWLWAALVKAILADEWTVQQARALALLALRSHIFATSRRVGEGGPLQS